MFKHCNACSEDKLKSEFGRNSSASDGLYFKCKSCRSAYLKGLYKEDKDSFRIRAKRWAEKPDVSLAEPSKRRARYLKNRVVVLQSAKEYRRSNLDLKRSFSARERAAKKMAVPHWLSASQISEISCKYRIAKRIEKHSGTKMHVDHIVPLVGESVCGLHVPWNLQIIPATENCSKGNRYVDPQ